MKSWLRSEDGLVDTQGIQIAIERSGQDECIFVDGAMFGAS